MDLFNRIDYKVCCLERTVSVEPVTNSKSENRTGIKKSDFIYGAVFFYNNSLNCALGF